MKLLVADNGAGIGKEDLKHIFERLYKCDKGRSQKGSGLGLSIVHQLVEKMGGSITVESAPGKGTEFTLVFPLDERAAPGHSGRILNCKVFARLRQGSCKDGVIESLTEQEICLWTQIPSLKQET